MKDKQKTASLLRFLFSLSMKKNNSTHHVHPATHEKISYANQSTPRVGDDGRNTTTKCETETVFIQTGKPTRTKERTDYCTYRQACSNGSTNNRSALLRDACVFFSNSQSTRGNQFITHDNKLRTVFYRYTDTRACLPTRPLIANGHKMKATRIRWLCEASRERSSCWWLVTVRVFLQLEAQKKLCHLHNNLPTN